MGRQTRQRNTILERVWRERPSPEAEQGKEQVKQVKQVWRGREMAVGKMGKGVWHLAWHTRDTISVC